MKSNQRTDIKKNKLKVVEFLRYLKNNENLQKLGTNFDNKNKAIHRWFSFLPGFSHKFVETTFNFFNVKGNNYCVYDPFMGCGTVAVVGKNLGIKVIGNESNRFLYTISKAKANILKKSDCLRKVGDFLLKECHTKWKRMKISSENALLKKCYSESNLKKLVALRYIYFSNSIEPRYKPYIFLAICSLLSKCAEVGISIPYVSWSHKRIAKEPFELFKEMIKKMEEDMVEFGKDGFNGDIRIYFHDSRKINSKINSDSVNFVFTSPPYLNNFDYGEALKVYTYFWKFTKDWGEITNKIRKKSVTSATTHYSESSFIHKTPKEILGDRMLNLVPETSRKIIKRINLINKARNKENRKKSFDILTALYFKDMLQVIKEMFRVLKNNSLAFIIIGDSAPYGVYVPTDKILGEMAIESGFSDYVLATLRPRGYKWLNLTYRHKIRLRESLLILKK